MADYINMHKRIAMGQKGAETHLKDGGSVGPKAEPSPKRSPMNDSSRKQPLPRATGTKIAVMKDGGKVKPKRGA